MNNRHPLPILPAMVASVAAGRLPDWDLSRLVHRYCPVCGAAEPTGVCQRPDTLTVARCPECFMLYLPDIPNEKNLKKFYEEYGTYKGIAPRRGSILPRIMPEFYPDLFVEILERTGGLKGER